MTADLSKFGQRFNTLFGGLIRGSWQSVTANPSIGTLANDLGNFLADLDPGQPATFSLVLSQQPTTTDTIEIGPDVYEFVTAGGAVADNANIGVPIGGTAAVTAANLVLAANGLQDDSGITMTDLTTPAVQNGSLALFAETVASPVRLVHFCTAATQGGTPAGANPSWELVQDITHASDVWTCGDVNVNTLGGRVASQKASTGLSLTITTAMLTPKQMFLTAPQGINGFVVQLRSATGAFKTPANDLVTLTADGRIFISLVGGHASDAADTDVYSVTYW